MKTEETTPPVTEPAVSATRLNTWLTCRLKYYYRYVERKPTPKTVATHVGSTVHTVLKLWSETRSQQRVIHERDLFGEYERAWYDALAVEPVKWEDEAEEAAAIRQGWALLTTYLRDTPIPANERVEAVEVTLEADLRIHGLPRLMGVVDLIRAGGRIVDYKTVGQTPTPEKAHHQHGVQLAMYAVLYRATTGRVESARELHQLVKLKTPKLVVSVQGPLTEGEKTRLYKQLESYQAGVARADYIPSPGMGCALCPYFETCRIA